MHSQGSDQMESSDEKVKSGESGANFGSAGSEREKANVETESVESRDEASYVFLRVDPVLTHAAAPVDRSTQPPPSTPGGPL